MEAKTLERFTTKWAASADGCWEWHGAKTGPGYGQFTMGGTTLLAHRVAYEHFVGPIPEGLQLDHLCRTRACVNPAHLEPVTVQENLHRSPIAPAGINARKTHCPQGHPYDEANTYVTPSTGDRLCRTCQREHSRRGHARRRSERKAVAA